MTAIAASSGGNRRKKRKPVKMVDESALTFPLTHFPSSSADEAAVLLSVDETNRDYANGGMASNLEDDENEAPSNKHMEVFADGLSPSSTARSHQKSSQSRHPNKWRCESSI